MYYILPPPPPPPPPPLIQYFAGVGQSAHTQLSIAARELCPYGYHGAILEAGAAGVFYAADVHGFALWVNFYAGSLLCPGGD